MVFLASTAYNFKFNYFKQNCTQYSIVPIASKAKGTKMPHVDFGVACSDIFTVVQFCADGVHLAKVYLLSLTASTILKLKNLLSVLLVIHLTVVVFFSNFNELKVHRVLSERTTTSQTLSDKVCRCYTVLSPSPVTPLGAPPP